MSGQVIHERLPKGQAKGQRSRGNEHGASASMQAVAMPCCGTTRRLRDDDGRERRLTCRKCGKGWNVAYLGAGKFKFTRRVA